MVIADPLSVAAAVKAAVTAAADERTWNTVGIITCAALLILLMPLIIIMSIMSGGADHNREYARIAFSGGPIPDGIDPEYTGYILKMQEAFLRLDDNIDTLDEEIGDPENSLDPIRIKAVFYSLYFGSDFSGMDDEMYSAFVDSFVITDSTGRPSVIKDMDEVYNNLSLLLRREITETDKQNINSTYLLIKYGYSSSPRLGGIPGEAFNDAEFAKLMNVATKYIGSAYVWGGSSPATGFDCSGFVCFCYTQSGVYNLPRTTAQGIFDQCIPVSADELKPGDLVFFTGTYKSDTVVSHLGIYVGDGQMLQCGEPRIGYADLSNSYWVRHLLGYGRLS